MDESKIVIPANDAKRLGYCYSGAKKICKKHNYDFKYYLKYGITIETLRSFNEPLCDRLANDYLAEIKLGETIITMREVKDMDFCVNGSIGMLKKHGIDWRDAVKNGIALARLREIDEPMARRLVKELEKKHSNGGSN